MESEPTQISLCDLPVDELIERIQIASDEDTSELFEEIIRRFTPLLRKCWARVGTTGMEYQDFVQDVFVRVFQSLPSLRQPKAFAGYFRRIALSVVTDHFRASMHRNDREIELDPRQIDKQIALVDRQVLSKVFVLSCLEHLGGREREIMRMELLDGDTPSEIAARLGILPGAVRMTRSRAIARLRQIMLSHADELAGRSATRDPNRRP